MTDPPIIVIGGPTATGKTALAVQLAQKLGGEIINADSQQIYRGLDVGTGKPAEAERGGVPHHLFDIVPAWEQFDAGQFVAAAEEALRSIGTRRRVAIIVGGTGLWIRALLKGLVDAPSRDDAIRKRLGEEIAQLGAPALHERLKAVDPDTAARVLTGDALRIIRALEVHELTGVPLGELHARHRAMPPRHLALQLGIDLPQEVLEKRIEVRVRGMFAGGILDETREAMKDPRAAEKLKRVIGYREAMEHLERRITLAQAIDATALAQRQYARRQRKWFKGEPEWKWLPFDRTFDAALAAVEAWVASRPHAD